MVRHKKKNQDPKYTVVTIKGRFASGDGGYGFVIQEDQTAEDIFIPPPKTGVALHGDEVLCEVMQLKPASITKSKGGRHPKAVIPPPMPQRKTGQVVEVLSREPLIGTYFTTGSDGYVRTMEARIPHIFRVHPKTISRLGLADGHRVIFTVPKNKPPRTASVTEVIGHIHDPGVDVLTLIHQYNVPHIFPCDALAQATTYTDEITQDDLEGRKDLRDQHIITIDGDDTKDIDDAISLTITEGGDYQLGVHIADVSHYVKPQSAIDKEAFSRGTSIYLADRVIPMLPHRLSSGLCSLFPNVDRLTVSCIMTVNKEGHVTAYDITPSVINSRHRYTYHEVQAHLDSDNCPPLLNAMDKLREILYKKRQARGALDFNLPDVKVTVDKDGRPVAIEAYTRTKATNYN